jgi:hypothetical protein
MNFLISLFKKAAKGDSFRPVEMPTKYNDQISYLNSTGNDQFNRMTTEKINKIGKTSPQLTPTTSTPGKLAGS